MNKHKSLALSRFFKISFLLLISLLWLSIGIFYSTSIDAFINSHVKGLNQKKIIINDSLDQDKETLLHNINHDEKSKALGITVIKNTPQISYSTYKPWTDQLSCRKSFNYSPIIKNPTNPLTLCVAIPNHDKNGIYLYVLAKYQSLSDTVHQHEIGNPKLYKSDYFRLEIVSPDGAAKQWIVAPESMPDTKKATSSQASNKDSFQLAIFSADSKWRNKKEKPEASNFAGGSITLNKQDHERYASFRIAYQLIDPNYTNDRKSWQHWPPKNIGDFIVRFSVHEIKDNSGPYMTWSTYNQLTSGDVKDIHGVSHEDLKDRVIKYLEEYEYAEILWNESVIDTIYPKTKEDIDQTESLIFKFTKWFSDKFYMPTIEPARIEIENVPVLLSIRYDDNATKYKFVQSLSGITILCITVSILCFIIYLAIHSRVIGRILCLSSEAEAIMQGKDMEFTAINDSDEIGGLARSFDRLIKKVITEERIKLAEDEARTRQHEVALREIGHEIRSPLQGLVAILPNDSPGRYYVNRMLRAVDHLLGAVAPNNNLSNIPLTLEKIELNEFLNLVSENAHYCNLDNIIFHSNTEDHIYINADPSALEDVITHILNNGDRYRNKNTPLIISLRRVDSDAEIQISNQGPNIPDDKLEEIFQYGTSTEEGKNGHQGQGLYVTRSYVTRMSGFVTAYNTTDGVSFLIRFPSERGFVA